MSSFGCVNNTILLRSGRYFDLRAPKAEDVTINDIAGALSKICRFGGQTPRFYSVAEHCCHCYDAAVADGLSYEIAKLALLHDAAEAFVGDIVKPLKNMLVEFAWIESGVQSAIEQAFLIEWDVDKINEVKRIDREILIAERLAIFGDDGVPWTGQDQVARRYLWVECWLPHQAEAQFLGRAKAIGIPIATGDRT
jgi:hypothetical protein